MRFGWKNAAGTLQLEINIRLSSVCWQLALVHLDDIIVFSSAVDTYLHNGVEVLLFLDKAGIEVKPKSASSYGRPLKLLAHHTSRKLAFETDTYTAVRKMRPTE